MDLKGNRMGVNPKPISSAVKTSFPPVKGPGTVLGGLKFTHTTP